jgi:hypothetical protein
MALLIRNKQVGIVAIFHKYSTLPLKFTACECLIKLPDSFKKQQNQNNIHKREIYINTSRVSMTPYAGAPGGFLSRIATLISASLSSTRV